MEFDLGKIDEAVLAVLYITLRDQNRAWKGVDWDALNRLHQAGCIHDPVNKAKSLVFTPEGLARAKQLAEQMFSVDSSNVA